MLSLRIRKRYYKSLGTRVINPNSPFFVFVLNYTTTKSNFTLIFQYIFRLYNPYVSYEDWKDTYVSSELTWLNLAAQLEFITDPLPSTFIVKVKSLHMVCRDIGIGRSYQFRTGRPTDRNYKKRALPLNQ